MDEHQLTPAGADDTLQTSRDLPSLTTNVENSGANLHNIEASDMLPKFSPVQALQMVEPQGSVHTGLTQFKYLPPEIRSMIVSSCRICFPLYTHSGREEVLCFIYQWPSFVTHFFA